MAWEYKVIYLAPGEPTTSWEAVANGYGAQLTRLGTEGWEVTQWQLPWVVLRRRVKDGAQDQAAPLLPEGLDIDTRDVMAALKALLKAQRGK